MKKAYYCAILSAATLFLLQSSCSNGNKEDVKKDNKKSSEKVKDPKSKEVKEEFKIVLKDSLPDFIKENCSYRGGGNIACDKVDGKRMQ